MQEFRGGLDSETGVQTRETLDAKRDSASRRAVARVRLCIGPHAGRGRLCDDPGRGWRDLGLLRRRRQSEGGAVVSLPQELHAAPMESTGGKWQHRTNRTYRGTRSDGQRRSNRGNRRAGHYRGNRGARSNRTYRGDRSNGSRPGATGATGEPGSGGLTAYGEVTSTGQVVAARSHNIASVTVTDVGRYCVLLDPSIDLSSHIAVANSVSSVIDSITTIVGDCGLPGRPGIQVTEKNSGQGEYEDFYLVVP